MVRKAAMKNPQSSLHYLRGFLDHLVLHEGTLESSDCFLRVFSKHQFDECYHLAAQSFVAEKLSEGAGTLHTNIAGVQHILSAMLGTQSECRMYFAGSSEMFGDVESSPQSEATPFQPRNPYGISKVAGYHLMRCFREQHGMFAACGILYNHESPRRGEAFVTQKIARAVARIKLGQIDQVSLGNLDATRDWGSAEDYTQAMWLMLQQKKPDDFVIATGVAHTVRDLCQFAFESQGLDCREHVVTDEALVRKQESVPLVGDASKAAETLGWKPQKDLRAIMREMVEAELERASS